ncbi:MAG TPA: hypothetical protein VFW96_28185 [Thermomicrobiales bacterium]|nr:hypothetical protein [Thermomicrobiales bacterium]
MADLLARITMRAGRRRAAAGARPARSVIARRIRRRTPCSVVP